MFVRFIYIILTTQSVSIYPIYLFIFTTYLFTATVTYLLLSRVSQWNLLQVRNKFCHLLKQYFLSLQKLPQEGKVTVIQIINAVIVMIITLMVHYDKPVLRDLFLSLLKKELAIKTKAKNHM